MTLFARWYGQIFSLASGSFTTICQRNCKKIGRYIDAAAFRPWSVPLLWPRSHALPQSYLINRLSERSPQKRTPSSLHTWGVGVCCLTLGIWAGRRGMGMPANTTTFSKMSLMPTLKRLGRAMISTDQSEAKCCYEHAQQCAEWASQEHDIEPRNAFLSLEAKWQSLAQNVGRDSIARDAFLRLDAMWQELAARRSGESQSALFDIMNIKRRHAVQARSQSRTARSRTPDASRWAMIRKPSALWPTWEGKANKADKTALTLTQHMPDR